jgi:LCP family protein required for cell wall assembly
MRSDRHIKRQQRNKWIRRIIACTLIFLGFLVGTALGYYRSRSAQFFDNVNQNTPEALQDTTEQNRDLENLRPFSVLILGLDEEDGVRRTDTIMVATINPDEESTKLISIPRDTLIEMPVTGQQEKINAVYARSRGDVTPLVTLVEEYLDIPISFYASLDFDGLVELVDAVGGIEVDSDRAFTVQDSEENMHAIEIQEGLQTLDGEHALGYARMRKQDPRGDWGRQERQREVIESLIDKLISLQSITNLGSILTAIESNLETNLNEEQILTIASNYTHAANNIDSLILTGEADYIYFPHYGQEVYVWKPFDETIEEIQEELRAHLELSEGDTPSTTGTLLDDQFEFEELETPGG